MNGAEEEAGNSVHDKFVQDGSPNHSKTDNGRKSDKFDCKVSIPNPTAGKRHDRKRFAVCLFIFVIFLSGAVAITTVLLIYRQHIQATVHVRCKAGVVRGRVIPSVHEGTGVAEFLGIPFALPPVKDLRYADPVFMDKLPQDPYDATDYRQACIQPLDTYFGSFPGSDMWNPKNAQSEDCLFLNIWVPRTANNSTKKAVMVWIYGGGFFAGSNSLWVYNGKYLAAYADVIVTSLNYRVGTFGYLSTGDGRIKGNFGMKDQTQALRWIQENIGSFGGDPALVTIFGESSGASSAGLHQMSHHSQRLFLRAIYQSGSPDAHWSFMTESQAKSRSSAFFSKVNCTMIDTEELLQCLRGLSTDTILNNEWVDSSFMVFPWAPSVDGDFLQDTPYNMLKAGRFQKKESLLGVNRDEGTYWIIYALPGFSRDGESLQNYSMFLNGVDQIAWDVDEGYREQIKQLYLVDGGSDGNANRDALDKVCGDRSFTCPTEQLAEIYSGKNIMTHFYYLTHRSSVEVWPPWMGVIHGADVQWVFGMPLDPSKRYTSDEVQFSKNLMTYWANFAKTGDPNGPNLPAWPTYSARHQKYLELRGAPADFVVRDTIRNKYCVLWRKINRQMNED